MPPKLQAFVFQFLPINNLAATNTFHNDIAHYLLNDFNNHFPETLNSTTRLDCYYYALLEKYGMNSPIVYYSSTFITEPWMVAVLSCVCSVAKPDLPFCECVNFPLSCESSEAYVQMYATFLPHVNNWWLYLVGEHSSQKKASCNQSIWNSCSIALYRLVLHCSPSFQHPPKPDVPADYCFPRSNVRINCDVKSSLMNYSEGFVVKFLCEKYMFQISRSPGDVPRRYFDNSVALQMIIAQF